MAYLSSLPFHLSLTVLLSLYTLEGAYADSTPYLNPGFEFNYNNQRLPLPITTQCERIHITWSRTGNETGPSPVAPYFMQVYSSASPVPYLVSAGFGPTFDWDVPFLPNTQYQTCMLDANGVSGGCQAIYTVLPNSTIGNTPCQMPITPTELSVSAVGPNGPMFQFSQVNQCETFSVTPQTGRPPYTLTIAPESHPPFNITSHDMKTISWKVQLPVGFKFFLLLSSADGEMWANGPMTVGGLGGDTCFGPGMITKSLFEKVVIGASIGGLVAGLVAGLLGCVVFSRWQDRKRAPSQQYLGRKSHYRGDSTMTRPLQASSTLNRSSSFGAVSSVPSSSMLSSIPLTPTTAERISEVPPLPQIPVTPPRPRRHHSTEPYIAVPSDQSPPPVQTEYPPDIKHPLPPSDVSMFSSSDTETLASSSNASNAYTRSYHRPLTAHSRAPTYVAGPRLSQLRSPAPGVPVAEEANAAEVPPEYGQHTYDPHLKYAPSILSSGNRF